MQQFCNINLLFSDVDHCHDAPCLNGGACTSTSTGFTCSCSERYYGKTCRGNNINNNNFHLRLKQLSSVLIKNLTYIILPNNTLNSMYKFVLIRALFLRILTWLRFYQKLKNVLKNILDLHALSIGKNDEIRIIFIVYKYSRPVGFCGQLLYVLITYWCLFFFPIEASIFILRVEMVWRESEYLHLNLTRRETKTKKPEV